MNRLVLAACLAIALTTGAATAPQSAPQSAPQNVPNYKVELLAHTDSGVFTNIFSIHILSHGGIIACDATRRRLLVFDSTLKNYEVVADTTAGGPAPYGNSSGGLLPYPGDSAAFVEQSSAALITIDRAGKMGRITALPNARDFFYLGGPLYGKPGFDVRGRLLMRTVFPPRAMTMPPSEIRRDTTIADPDSAPVLRVDFDAQRVDTLAMIRVAGTKWRMLAQGGRAAILNPIPFLDEWAFDRDGTVALIRGHDYHIDWILPDGTKKSTPKMPMNWRRLTDEDKRAVVDSVRRVADSSRKALVDRMIADAERTGTPARVPTFAPLMIVEPSELPDYYPAIKASSRPRFDLDGNLWVIPSTTFAPDSTGGLVYDVIDRSGTLLKRVQIPAGRVLSGFGKGNLIYITAVGVTVAGIQTQAPRVERGRIVPR